MLASTYWQADHDPAESKAKGAHGAVVLGPILITAFAIIGMADAFYDSYAIYTGQQLWCPPPIDGCNIVASSPYARVADVPLGYFGFVYYLYMFGLGTLLTFDPWSRGLRLGAVLYAAAGVFFSIYFMYVQLTYIHAFCIYCLISGILTLLLSAAALGHYRATRSRAYTKRK
jgi:uncharacterized membrane protein